MLRSVPQSFKFPFKDHQCIKLIYISYAKINSMQSSVVLYCIVAFPAAVPLPPIVMVLTVGVVSVLELADIF